MIQEKFKIHEETEKEKELAFVQPGNKDTEAADQARARKIASLIRNGDELLSRNELDKFLLDKGIWSSEDSEKAADLQKKNDEALDKLRQGNMKLLDARQVCIDITARRYKMVTLMQKRQLYDATTLEAQGEKERQDYLIYACTLTEEGEKYWTSFDTFKEDTDSEAYEKAAVTFYKMLHGEDNEFEKRMPEIRWLKKWGFVDENLNYVDRESGKFVNAAYDSFDAEQEQEALVKQLQNLQGEIVEEAPFLDSKGRPLGEDGKPIKKTKAKKTTRKSKVKKPAVAT